MRSSSGAWTDGVTRATIRTPETAGAVYAQAMPLVRPVLAAMLAAVCLALTGCGNESAPPPLSETLPACDEVWVAGQILPDDYAGCRDGDGVLQVSEIKNCTKNDEQLTTYGDMFYALLGSKVYDDGVDSPAYDELYAGCFGASW